MNVGFIGAGHIAHCLAQGWARRQDAEQQRPVLLFYDVVPERAAEAARDGFGSAFSDLAEVVAASDVVVIAVRPPDVAGVLSEVRSHLGRRLLISVAAFVPLERLAAELEPHARVCRVMPNVAAAVGEGVFLFAPGALDVAGRDLVRRLFSATGELVEVDEEGFDVATAVSGCGPGFMALFVEALADVAADLGLDYATAVTLAARTLVGTGELIAEDGDPAGLRRGVAVPGGMTAAGVAALEEGGFSAAVAGAVRAAVALAREHS